jgi:hypothetical protein
MGIASGNQPPFDYEWTYPDGSFSTSDPFLFNVTQSDAGLYSLLVTDIVGCTDQTSIELTVSENPVKTAPEGCMFTKSFIRWMVFRGTRKEWGR